MSNGNRRQTKKVLFIFTQQRTITISQPGYTPSTPGADSQPGNPLVGRFGLCKHSTPAKDYRPKITKDYLKLPFSPGPPALTISKHMRSVRAAATPRPLMPGRPLPFLYLFFTKNNSSGGKPWRSTAHKSGPEGFTTTEALNTFLVMSEPFGSTSPRPLHGAENDRQKI